MTWRNSLKRLAVFEIAAILALALAVGVAIYASLILGSNGEDASAGSDADSGALSIDEKTATDAEADIVGAVAVGGANVDNAPIGTDESDSLLVVAAERLSTDPAAARDNSLYLQGLIDQVFRSGGGTVRIPEGTFRFAATAEYDLGSYAIEMRSHVVLAGAGQKATVLMPVGSWADTGLYEHGVDMFAYFGLESGEYLVDADFHDFTIDGAEACGSPDGYTASGKGFFFKLFKDCDWLNVTVRNTDGTGFGVDFPIDSTIINCTATGCGKNATPEDVGASGFGIGTGYSNLESITISNCRSYDNTKFGFFFEHQTRFNPMIEALYAQGFKVVDCAASGNLYNFGGARAHDVAYVRCTSSVSANPEREAYTMRAFCFENHSCRTRVIDCTVEQRYSDVSPQDECFDAVSWALSEGLLECAPSDSGLMLFNPQESMLRGEAASLLWRYAGRPSEVAFQYTPDMPRDYGDVVESDYYIDAALWMRAIGNSANEEFRGSDPITRAELVTMLWRMAGRPGEGAAASAADGATSALPFNDIEPNAFYGDALAWAVDEGLVPDDGDSFRPYDTCTRSEVIMLLQFYDEEIAD